MLKITPYLGIIILIVSIGGLWFPKLGYFLLIVFATLLAIAPFRGRWFCGNLCPRGSFNDFWLGKITFKKNIPKFFRSLWLRIPVFIAMMGFMFFRLITVEKLVDKIGMVFVIMCIVTTLIAILFGISIAPRTWCSFCPMGTVQNWLGKGKYTIKFDKSKCIDCGICNKVCPMQLTVNQITHNPDCIKCGRCISACPKKALKF
ncbi:4Fe-4S binding protein [Candidatus Woesearchaeota archaeon]|jgi:ferredoxin-type protein NapH|nr:4Fe-4S binding protein [Candidatus Woesearchaeota archaeon]MBT5272049.1 4Fe-4S binding protein [Candidatus Woesearchaeota archaeon]MBT6041799.1 4Fe-4S binding protein [Candidatus Woesearchaeota archaeon]MBT6336826.1 4Fe-4S binding protein [Candidatus Woesearchaeota archaeon]MBT7927639.1 4Fe-4S binding protein [Candidatus Woesearchaeota archaeon]